MDCKYVIGQKVICVKLIDAPYKDPAVRPTIGCVYTIKDIAVINFGHLNGEVGLMFEEIPIHSALTGLRKIVHPHWHFRPCKDTDITVFQQMLKTAPKELQQV